MIDLSQRWRSAVLAAAPLVLLSTAALAQDRGGNVFDNLFSRGERQEQNRQAAPPSEESEATVRIGRLENQLRQLTGQIEQLQFRNQQLEAALKRAQEDNEFRFQQLGAKGAAPSAGSPSLGPSSTGAPAGAAPTLRNPPQALPPAASPQTPGRRSDVFDPNQSPNAPGAPRALGEGTAATAEPEVAVGAPGGRAAGAPLDLSSVSGPPSTDPGSPPPRVIGAPSSQVATLPPTQSPKDEYDLAYGYVLRKDYALAEQSFRDFVKKHPGDALAPDANYWLGETLFQRQRYQDAADAFL
ncbi:MAG: tetratricopeptide repeat protein, partial [Pseudolabrys sp.]|nr:tetratricopeptide repeat protein [Pseudolabrys sp.]